MNVNLTREQAAELLQLLEGALRDLSHEIAATDNPRYRGQLNERRQLLAEVSESIRPALRDETLVAAEAVERELAHPGG